MSRNPFLDLGFPREEAAALHIRSQLAAVLEQYLERKGGTQVAAARALKVPQPTISKIVNGKIERLSIEFLIKLMVRAGLPVEISGGRASGTRARTRHRHAQHLPASA
ncbi:MAG: helix-turn-helix domain-containing protein [Steroidobacteraceae bacterium]